MQDSSSTTISEVSSSIQSPKKGPRVGAAVLVVNNKGKEPKILLGERAKDPMRGMWIIPGGGVKFLEDATDAVRREIIEETGIDIVIEKLIGVYQLITTEPPDHRIIFYWQASPKSLSVSASSDLSRVQFFTKEQIERKAKNGEITPTVMTVLKNAGWLADFQLDLFSVAPVKVV